MEDQRKNTSYTKSHMRMDRSNRGNWFF